jgi:hypothetical protein
MNCAAEGVHHVTAEVVKGSGDCGDDAKGECEERFSCEHDRQRKAPGLNAS